MYTLYGAAGSGSAAIEAALTLCGAPWKLVKAEEPNQDFEALKRINPLGLVPTLVLPDGSVLTESAAILIHLGEAHPESGLVPSEGSARAQVIRGLVYIVANCYAAIGIIDYPERWCSPCDEDTAKRIRAGTRARLHHYWEVFADLHPAQPWLNGAQLSALDLLAAVVSRWSGSRAHLKRSRPSFHQTLQRIDADPRIAAIFSRHWP